MGINQHRQLALANPEYTTQVNGYTRNKPEL